MMHKHENLMLQKQIDDLDKAPVGSLEESKVEASPSLPWHPMMGSMMGMPNPGWAL